MGLTVFDSATRGAVALEPRTEGRIAMYVCGPTVYDYIHIGNARTFVWFDLIRRYLLYRGYDVTYVLNYTDVDDKVIERARREGVDEDVIARRYSAAFEADMAALRVLPPDVLVRATEHVEDMVAAVQGLIERGFAYEAEGNVFFAVERFPGYGKLSHRTLDDMRGGERIEPHPAKHHPLDFALWKAAKDDEPSWSSPWGPGRPGWHIECSVMSVKYLGMGFDIHGGGSDLIFPHHENEIAQAEALAGEAPFVRHWLHSGMVQMDVAKMSKSLGNTVAAAEVLKRYPGEVVRYWALSGSYRSQVIFSDDALADASAAYERWRNFLEAARHALSGPRPRSGADGVGAPYVERFRAALDDDFNSPEAFAVLHDIVREGNRSLEDHRAAGERRLLELTEVFTELTSALGFGFERPHGATSELVQGLVSFLLELRESARSERSFERADEIRERLARFGITVEDTSVGPRWRFDDRG